MAANCAPSNSGVASTPSMAMPAVPTPKILTTDWPVTSGVSKIEFCSGICITRFLGSLEQTAKQPFQKRALGASAIVFKRTVFHKADGGGELRLIQRGGQAADGSGVAGRDVHLKNIFRERHEARHARAAAAEENPGAQIIGEAGLLQFMRDELENFLQPQRHDALEMLVVEALEFEAEFIGDADGLAFHRVVDERGAVFNF